ncbi:hypothetical protein QBC41DRAFT_228903 [Cercophora samala]|uniref:F-box domain-containing protein n=1 Tax=Cercophora samala TaxID=330535 RepID=A0AA40D9W2_9PEZI|nr:hypothetical protein QBC41DRAFT_228903 [Cercophora samala]
MPLLKLPPEILIQIFDHVGSRYFRSDLSRLTVCKRWNQFAHIVCSRQLYITPRILRQMVLSPYVESSLHLMETLDLELEGFVMRRPETVLDSNSYSWNSAPGLWSLRRRVRELNDDLAHLASIMRQSQRLCTLRIKAIFGSDYFQVGSKYLFSSTIRSLLLSTSNLSVLELDLCSTHPEPQDHPHHGDDSHVCPMIATLLPTLRCLRLRMPVICSDALKPPQHCSDPLRLRVLLVSFVLPSTDPVYNEPVLTIRCGGPGRFVRLRQVVRGDMVRQSRVLAARMSAPKMVRILTHVLASGELGGVDVLTGKEIKLREGAEWDDDGEAVED